MAEINANMAGTVAELKVGPGDKVEEGQTVAVVESMKMLIEFKSDKAGIVKEVRKNVGEFINEGEVLLTLE